MDPVSASILVGGMLGSGAISYFGSQASAAQEYHTARKMMGLQYKYHNKGLLESPSYQLKGLQKAGLNPLLYMGGGASYPAVSQGSVSVPDWGKGVSEAVMNSARTFADLQSTQSQAKVNDAQADNINVNTMNAIDTHEKKLELLQSQIDLNNANKDKILNDKFGYFGLPFGMFRGPNKPVMDDIRRFFKFVGGLGKSSAKAAPDVAINTVNGAKSFFGDVKDKIVDAIKGSWDYIKPRPNGVYDVPDISKRSPEAQKAIKKRGLQHVPPRIKKKKKISVVPKKSVRS